MNLALLITDGPGVRNFLLGDFFERAAKERTVHVLQCIPARVRQELGLEGKSNIKWWPLYPHRETKASFVLRNALVAGHMYRMGTRAMRFNLNLPLGGPLHRKTVVRASRLLGRFAAVSSTGIQLLDEWHCAAVERFPEVEHYRQILLRISPSVLFCSNQRPPAVLPAVLAAKSLGIPTATFIFSWDNLTSKGRIAAPFDHYLVWSESMRNELRQFYPSISGRNIHIVGTPQFDPYVHSQNLWPREEFFRRLGADESRPLICYSGGDTSICPEDPAHLSILMRLIREGSIMRNPQVVLRPSPADLEDRYEHVKMEFPEVIIAPPCWAKPVHNEWSMATPLPEDTQMLTNLTRYSDLNINVASTMTLDFAINDKPVVNIAWDVASPPPFGTPLWDHHYQFEHYRPVVEFGAARFARSPDELAQHVNTYLDNPNLDREGRRRFVELEVGDTVGRSGRRILEALEQIVMGNGNTQNSPPSGEVVAVREEQ
jgi:hypothetical protein